jgi:hypothetical protein
MARTIISFRRPEYFLYTMLEKLKNAGPCNLLPLLVMLYISVGMPLVHPLIHAHAEHDWSVSTSGDRFLQNPTHEGKAHHCPICGFKATNQLHASPYSAALAGDQSIDDFVSTESSFWLSASPQRADARAPPVLSVIS